MKKYFTFYLLLVLAVIMINSSATQADDIAYTIHETFFARDFYAIDPFGLGSNPGEAIINFTVDPSQTPYATNSYSNLSRTNYVTGGIAQHPEGYTTLTLTGTNMDGTYNANYYGGQSAIDIKNYFTGKGNDEFGLIAPFKLPDGNTYNFLNSIQLPVSFWGDNATPPIPKIINQSDVLIRNLIAGVISIETGTPYGIGAYAYKDTATSISSKIIDIPKETSKIYGLFEGIRIEPPYVSAISIVKGDEAAQKIHAQFSPFVNDSRNLQDLIGSTSSGGLTKSAIGDKITNLKNQCKDGDNLFIYLGTTHGGVIKGTSNYFIQIGAADPHSVPFDAMLTSQELRQFLTGIDNVNKWVFIDACESGGFWHELSQLKNLGLCAASGEVGFSYLLPSGISLFTYGLEYSLTIGLGGKYNADYNMDGSLTFDELESYISHWWTLTTAFKNLEGTTMFELDTGDPIIFTSDMWNPVGYKTDGFIGALSVNPVPLPSTLLLLGSGLLGLAGWRRVRKG